MRTPRGRTATQAAYGHFGLAAPAADRSQPMQDLFGEREEGLPDALEK